MNTDWADLGVLSVYELGELTRKRDRAADEHWLELCRAFLTDSETNAAAIDARDWFERNAGSASDGTDTAIPEDRLRNWLSAGLPFRLAAPFRADQSRTFSDEPYRFLRTLLYPAACEWVARDADRGLAEFITRDLEAEKHVNRSSPTDAHSSVTLGPPSTNGSSQDRSASIEDLERLVACGLDDPTFDSAANGIFTTPARVDPPEAEFGPTERMTSAPSQHVSAVKGFDTAVSKLVASGRLDSAKHRRALSRLRRDFRHLAEVAFHRPDDCDETGSTLFYAACHALGWADGASLEEFRASAGALAGKVTELSGFTRARSPQTNKKRQERIGKNVKRYAETFDARLFAEAKRLGSGDLKFETEQAATYHIVQALEWAVPKPLAISIAGQFVVYCEGEGGGLGAWPITTTGSPETRIDGPFGFDWTVREQELRELKEVAGLLAAVYVGADELTSLILATTCMLWRLKRKGVVINPLQRAVLIALRRGGPSSIPALTARLGLFGEQWTPKDIEDTLNQLKGVRLDDGTVTPLVHETSDGLWSTDARGLWEVPFGTFG